MRQKDTFIIMDDDFIKRVIAASIFLVIALGVTGLMLYLLREGGSLAPKKVTPSEFPDYKECGQPIGIKDENKQ